MTKFNLNEFHFIEKNNVILSQSTYTSTVFYQVTIEKKTTIQQEMINQNNVQCTTIITWNLNYITM